MDAKVTQSYQKLTAAAEARLAEATPEGVIRIQVGSATCENAAGAQEVWQEFERNIRASGRTDIQLHMTGCTGRCSREPIVSVFLPGKMPVKYQRVDRDTAHNIFSRHVQGGEPMGEQVLDQPEVRPEYEVLVCDAKHCGACVNGSVENVFREELERAELGPEKVGVLAAGCLGFCSVPRDPDTTSVLVRPGHVVYNVKTAADVARIVKEHFVGGGVVADLQSAVQPISQRFFDLYGDVAFFNRQNRIALRNTGVVNPESLDEYIHYNGFRALADTLSKGDPDWVIDQITRSNLRGRGGGGFSTGQKWKLTRQNVKKTCYIICNADEGDPGAFMDRSMLESDPFSVIEGMIIGGYAVGATRGFFYVRAEYPLAIRRIEHAIAECRKHGLLGKNILGSGFDMDLEIRLGAGAFVCGEETALIHSIEGERGQPRIRPPFPAQSGLWGQPTVINNVETFANVPAILVYGAEWFAKVGTAGSGGTKVFALAGKVSHTGLVEVPMGTTLREVVFKIGGGVPKGKRLKGVQTGGPAGGIIPADSMDTPIDFDTLGKMGSIMGSGGMIVLDEDDCMVDVAKFFVTFCQDESCGKCTPCREGTKRMLEILDKITMGKASMEDLEKLERLALLVKNTSMCGLGRAAPNPVLSTLRHFRAEYEAHVLDHSCPSRKCKALVRYEVDAEKCVGCTMCARNCPVGCISGARKEPHVIGQAECIKCGRCFEVCRFDAVARH
ncbi:MAG: NADH-quinone oxidoreductase subunit NuoF [Candidatus Hydrogenedens sp.]|nr:NADH-quinone oxidoreductase subunit NuoF [Candidatus Hydrogenedens sp.]